MEGGLGIKGENQGKHQSSVSAWVPQEGLSPSALLGGMDGWDGTDGAWAVDTPV